MSVATDWLELGLTGPKVHAYTLPDGTLTVVQGTPDSPGAVLMRKFKQEGNISGVAVNVAIPAWVNKIRMQYNRAASTAGAGICAQLKGTGVTAYRGGTGIYSTGLVQQTWEVAGPNPGIALRGNPNTNTADYTGLLEISRMRAGVWLARVTNSTWLSGAYSAQDNGHGTVTVADANMFSFTTFSGVDPFQAGGTYQIEMEA